MEGEHQRTLDEDWLADEEPTEEISRVDRGRVVDLISEELSQRPLTPAERQKVFVAMKAMDKPTLEAMENEKVRRQFVEEAMEQAIGQVKEPLFQKEKTPEEHARKQEVDDFIHRMVLMGRESLSDNEVSSVVQALRKGEYWKKSDAQLRDEFESLKGKADGFREAA